MNPPGLIRVLGRLDTLTLAFGAMIGWSWVALGGLWITSAGSLGAIAAFAVGGAAIVVIGLTYAELAAALPQAGGEHVYSERAFGARASFVCSWAILLGYVSVVAFEAVALPTVVEYLVPDLSHGRLWRIAGWDVHASWVAIGMAAAALITWINVRGIRIAARSQVVATTVIVLGGFLLLGAAGVEGEPDRLPPLFVDGARGWLTVLVMVPFLFVGFDVIPQSAEEIDLPFAQIGRLLVVSILIAVAWYAGIVWAIGVGLEPAERAAASLPTSAAASALLGGRWGGQAIVVAGIAGILTSWNAFLIGASRLLFALARSGSLPAWIGELHPRYRTPYRAILIVGGLSILAPLLGRSSLVWFVNAGGFGIVIAYAFVAAAFLALRRQEPGLERPYRVRHGTLVGAAALLLAVAFVMLYLPFSPSALAWPQEWLIVLGWAGLGALLYRARP